MPAPWLGGLDTSAYGIIRALVLIASLLLFIQFLADPSRLFESNWPLLRQPLLFILLFINLALLQASFLNPPHLGFLPGSIQSYETRTYAVQMVFYLLLFLNLIYFFSSRSKVRMTAVLLAIQIIFLIALGYHQELGGLERQRLVYGFYRVSSYMSFYSSFLNSNHYGGYLFLASPLFLAAILYWCKKNKPLFSPDSSFAEFMCYLVLLPVMAASVLFAGARAALVMLLVLFFVYFIKVLRSGFRYRAVVLVIFLGVFFSFVWRLVNPDLLVDYRKLLGDLPARWVIYRDSFKIFLDYPIFGTGLGTYSWISKVYQSVDAESFWLIHAHNEVLELLTDTGIVGACLFLAAVCTLIFPALFRALSSHSQWCRIYGGSSFCAIVFFGILSQSEFYAKTPAIAILFLAHMAVLTKSYTLHNVHKVHGHSKERVPAQSFSTRAFLAYSIVGVLLIVFLASAAYGDHVSQKTLDRVESYKKGFYEKGETLATTRKKNRDFRALHHSISLVPDNPKSWMALGDSYYFQAFEKERGFDRTSLDQSVEAYQNVVKLAPTWSDAWFYLGKSKFEMGRGEDGLMDMEKGLSFSPNNRDSYLYLIVHYLEAADLSIVHEKKKAFQERARFWLEGCNQLGRPFMPNDYNYIGLGALPLSREDEVRLLAFLTSKLGRK